jgi:hypothetical protein
MSDSLRIDADQPAGAALGDVELVDHLQRRRPFGMGRRQRSPTRLEPVAARGSPQQVFQDRVVEHAVS